MVVKVTKNTKTLIMITIIIIILIISGVEKGTTHKKAEAEAEHPMP